MIYPFQSAVPIEIAWMNTILMILTEQSLYLFKKSAEMRKVIVFIQNWSFKSFVRLDISFDIFWVGLSSFQTI